MVTPLLAGACGQPPNAPVVTPPATAPSASAPAALPVDTQIKSTVALLPPPEKYGFMKGAWTDPEAIAGLALDCHYEPKVNPDDLSPMTCVLHAEQSCVASACNLDYEDCLPGCAKACDTCAATCTSSCESCKSTCKDDACKLDCATHCGACRQRCLVEKDHCGTGDCGAKETACTKKLEADWLASDCVKKKPRFDVCRDQCVDHPTKKVPPEQLVTWGRSCQEKCEKQLMPGCHQYFIFYVAF
jgi:hypothetical protein